MISKAHPLFIAIIACLVTSSLAFAPYKPIAVTSTAKPTGSSLYIFGGKKTAQTPPPQAPKKTISGSRRKQLGISDNEDEYDLGVALATNTDPLITKVIHCCASLDFNLQVFD